MAVEPYLCQEKKEERRPEELGLRPLPQFRSLEEATRALGPRRIPSAAEVEAELRLLELEESAPGSPPLGGKLRIGSGSPTALAKDQSDYFGFVG